MPYLLDELRKAATFGGLDPHSVTGFFGHFLLLAVPGILLGHIIDEGILLLQQRHRLSAGLCLVGQTVVWAFFFLFLHNAVPRYGAEFQSSYAGLAFVTLFFTVQSNYVRNLQSVLQFADREGLHIA